MYVIGRVTERTLIVEGKLPDTPSFVESPVGPTGFESSAFGELRAQRLKGRG